MNFNAIRIRAPHFRVLRQVLKCTDPFRRIDLTLKKQIIMGIKLTSLILLISVMTVSATTFAQKITLNEKKAALGQVLEKIRLQSGYDFIYTDNLLSKTTPVSIILNNGSLEDALKASLKNQPLTYEIEDRTVILKMKETGLSDNPKTVFVAVDVHGRVVDKNGEALAGATIKIKGTTTATTSGSNGEFFLSKVDDGSILVVTFIGFSPVEIAAKAEMGSIKMNDVDAKLNEVQVIAYGTTSKKFSTSNIGSVSGNIISRQPVTNPLLALEGRVAGLFIQQNSGLNTGSINVTVQGKNSLANNNVPFYVIDGVPYTPNDINQGLPVMGSIGTGAMSTLNFVNPADIESIEILKDADATSIYGSRAANGAILITTKKGKAGQTKVDLNLQNGWGKVAKKPSILNLAEYLDLRREAKKNANTTAGASDYDINGVWDTTRNTDWQRELIGGTAHYQNLQASVSGGSDLTQFLIGAGYNRETPVFSGDFSNIKTSVHFNINHTSPNQKFKIFLSGSYLEGINRLPQTDMSGYANTLAPDAPKLYNSDGTINWEPEPGNPGTVTFQNPAAELLTIYKGKTNNLISNSQVSYELSPGLVLKSSFGYNRLQSDELGTVPIEAIRPDDRLYNKRSASYANKSIRSWIIEPQLTFNKTYSFGIIDALLGTTFQKSENDILSLYGFDYSSDALLPDINAAGQKNVVGSLQSTYKYNALFGRLNYRLKDRYIINLTARRDGSSRFGSENLFHSFYSVGGGWLFSEERFFQNVLPVINYGKLRATYGTTGNDQIGDYQFYSLYDNYGGGIPYQNTIGLLPRGLSNPFLQWEETNKLNLGIDLGFFDNKILINANYFRNRSSNQLLYQNFSVVTGTGGILRNLPATVQNTGWELTVDFVPVSKGDFRWRGSANITLPRNKLIRYDGLAESGDRNQYVIGQSINIKKVFTYAGVNPQTGLYQFLDANGGLTSKPDDLTDKTSLVNTDPKWYAGFGNSFSYKGFDLDVFFQFVSQKALSNRFGNFPGISFNSNQPKIVLDRWHNPGDQASIQKVSTDFNEVFQPLIAALSSDAAYGNASYARLKNVSLSYKFDSGFIRKAHIYNARVYVQGQNLLTITKFNNGVDPETQAPGQLGTLRMITLGTQLTF